MPIPQPQVLTRNFLRDQAVSRIRRAILDGRFVPGDPLDDAMLVRWLGVSRTTVRMALAELAGRGLVELRPRRSARVAQIQLTALDDAATTMGVLMRGVVLTSVPDLARSEQDYIARGIDETVEALRSLDPDVIRRDSITGYRRWAEVSRNPVLADVLRQRTDGLVVQTSTRSDPRLLEWVMSNLGALRAAVVGNDRGAAERAIVRMHLSPATIAAAQRRAD
jgi:DNA-binding GntR family transcriptional regulator